MKSIFFSCKEFERPYLKNAFIAPQEITFIEEPLSLATVEKTKGYEVVSVFTGDDVSAPVIEELHQNGVGYIAIRAAGYDNVDLQRGQDLGFHIANVPAYSPYAIAEHAVTLMLALNRKLVTSDRQVHLNNFKLDNLVGFDLHKKTVGIIGTGKTGSVLAKIMNGFGCRILGHDIRVDNRLVKNYGMEYTDMETLCKESDIISLHTLLNADTRYLIDAEMMAHMKPGVMLINTSRGACLKTDDLIQYLDNGHIGYFGADVYENEKDLFFFDLSETELKDKILKKLLAMPNVLITPHQAFATREALTNIAGTTFENVNTWSQGGHSINELSLAESEAVR